MLKSAESPRSIQRGKISWEQAQSDLQTAKSFLKSSPGKSSLLSAQAAVNALSSVLEAHGYFQLPTFSAVELVGECVNLDSNFESIRSACYVLDGTIERDMFGMQHTETIRFTPSFAKSCFKSSEQVIKHIKAYWKQNKDRFFTP